MANIFLSSSSGFINELLIKFLLEKGFTVYAVNNNKNIVESNNLTLVDRTFLYDKNFISELMSLNIDCFIHSGYTIDAGIDDSVSENDITGSGQVDAFLYDSLVKAGIPKVILFSTSLAYGERKGMAPAMETDNLYAYNNYTTLKERSESSIKKIAKMYNNSKTFFSVFRISPVYNDEYYSNIIPYVYDDNNHCYFLFTESGGYVFSLCHINNLLDAVRSVILEDNLSRYRSEISPSIAIFNVCDSIDYSALEMVTFLKKNFKEAPVLINNPKFSIAGIFRGNQKKVNVNYFDASKYMNNRRVSNALIRQIVTMRWKLESKN